MNVVECTGDTYSYRQVFQDTTFMYPDLCSAKGVHVIECILHWAERGMGRAGDGSGNLGVEDDGQCVRSA